MCSFFIFKAISSSTLFGFSIYSAISLYFTPNLSSSVCPDIPSLGFLYKTFSGTFKYSPIAITSSTVKSANGEISCTESPPFVKYPTYNSHLLLVPSY